MTAVVSQSDAVLGWAPSRRSTPELLTASAVAIVGLCLVYALWSVAVTTSRRGHVAVVADTTAVALHDGQYLRTTLADADATGASLFLTGPLPDPTLRARYDLALARAAATVTSISRAEADDPDVARITDRLAVSLVYYAGLVDTALANHRQGFPLAQAYLAQANTYMRDDILLGVDDLVALEQDRLEQRLGATASPGPAAGPVLTLLVALGALVGTQRWLSRTFRRSVNLPLLAATAFLGAALVAQVVTLATLRAEISATRTEGAEPLAYLTGIRALALEARSYDALRLVTADTVPAYVTGSEESQDALERLLTSSDRDLLVEFPGQTSLWSRLESDREDLSVAHDRITTVLDTDLNQAIDEAIGDDEDQLTAVGDRFDADLDEGIGWAAEELRIHIERMSSLLGVLRASTVTLSAAAALCTLFGIRQRLGEYR